VRRTKGVRVCSFVFTDHRDYRGTGSHFGHRGLRRAVHYEVSVSTIKPSVHTLIVHTRHYSSDACPCAVNRYLLYFLYALYLFLLIATGESRLWNTCLTPLTRFIAHWTPPVFRFGAEQFLELYMDRFRTGVLYDRLFPDLGAVRQPDEIADRLRGPVRDNVTHIHPPISERI